MAIAKDAAQQLYKSIWSTLTGDSDLSTLLGGTDPSNPKVFQTFIDFTSEFALKHTHWVTFNVVSDRPMDIEQMQDVHEFLIDVHVWMRGPGSDTAELIEKRVRELLDNADLSTENLFSWYCYFDGYSKVFEAQPMLWHVTATYRILCMAQDGN